MIMMLFLSGLFIPLSIYIIYILKCIFYSVKELKEEEQRNKNWEMLMNNKKIDSLYREIEELTKKALIDIDRLDYDIPEKEMEQVKNRIGLNLMFIEDLRMELIKTIEEVNPDVKVAWVLNFEQMLQHINNKQSKGE
jgi:hypothetical protein